MDYRFFIYKQSVLVNFDKYDFAQYTLLREITNIAQWNLKIERDREFFPVIRTSFEGEVTVIGDDYTALKALENTHIQYAVVIHQKCNGVYSEKWKGFFSYFDYKPDEDQCNLKFQPTVWDIYSPIFDQFSIERNALAAGVMESVLMDAFEWPYESIGHAYTYNSPQLLANWHEYAWDVDVYPVGNMFYLYTQTTINLGYDGVCDCFKLQVTEEFRRDVGYTTSNVTSPPGTNWVLDPLLPGGESSPGVYKWVRPFLNSLYTTYSPPGSSSPWVETLLTASIESEILSGYITLKATLEYFATFFNLDYVSQFFNATPCPMGGTTLELTGLLQISNVRDTAEVASKGMLKLKDLLTWIRDTFNVYWFIDATGDWRLEHRRYFDNGLSYSYTHIIELDLTSATYSGYVNKMNKYEYAKPSLVRFEKLEFPYSYFPDWTEAGIEYPQLSILGNDERKLTVEWGTDIISMLNYNEELPKIGWVLLNINWVDIGGGVSLKKVINTVGAMSNQSFQNARFSPANLFRDLWTWGRLLPTGNVNGVSTTFDSIQKLKQQKELSIPICCTALDYNGLVRSELGDGIIDTAMYESKSGNLKINLIYE